MAHKRKLMGSEEPLRFDYPKPVSCFLTSIKHWRTQSRRGTIPAEMRVFLVGS